MILYDRLLKQLNRFLHNRTLSWIKNPINNGLSYFEFYGSYDREIMFSYNKTIYTVSFNSKKFVVNSYVNNMHVIRKMTGKEKLKCVLVIYKLHQSLQAINIKYVV